MKTSQNIVLSCLLGQASKTEIILKHLQQVLASIPSVNFANCCEFVHDLTSSVSTNFLNLIANFCEMLTFWGIHFNIFYKAFYSICLSSNLSSILFVLRDQESSRLKPRACSVQRA